MASAASVVSACVAVVTARTGTVGREPPFTAGFLLSLHG
jgi:hypothetical protein